MKLCSINDSDRFILLEKLESDLRRINNWMEEAETEKDIQFKLSLKVGLAEALDHCQEKIDALNDYFEKQLHLQ